MVAYEVLDVKNCMNKLLREDAFDFFLLQEATINTFATFSIDGHRLDDYYSDVELAELDEQDALMPYEMFRDKIFDVIKGKKTPLSVHIMLSLPRRVISQIIEAEELSFRPEEAHLVAIFKFVDGRLTITTGSSMNTFTLDKSLEQAFDRWMFTFLNSVGVEFDKIS